MHGLTSTPRNNTSNMGNFCATVKPTFTIAEKSKAIMPWNCRQNQNHSSSDNHQLRPLCPRSASSHGVNTLMTVSQSFTTILDFFEPLYRHYLMTLPLCRTYRQQTALALDMWVNLLQMEPLNATPFMSSESTLHQGIYVKKLNVVLVNPMRQPHCMDDSTRKDNSALPLSACCAHSSSRQESAVGSSSRFMLSNRKENIDRVRYYLNICHQILVREKPRLTASRVRHHGRLVRARCILSSAALSLTLSAPNSPLPASPL